MALGFGGYALFFSNIAELGWPAGRPLPRGGRPAARPAGRPALACLCNLPEIFSKRDRYGVLAMYMPPNRVSPSALGLGALTYTN